MAGLDPVDNSVLQKYCLNDGDEGFVCTRQAEHLGAHRAQDTITGEVYDTWANRNDDARE